jgi:hypothetical protein
MAGGGSKPGERRGGRKRGTPNRASAARQAEAAAEGVMPCEVMLANMRFAYARALELQGLWEGLDRTDEASIAVLDELVRYRQLAHDFAKDAANYYHPKLASVTHKGNAENPLLGPVTDTDRLKAMIEFLLANRGAEAPTNIENASIGLDGNRPSDERPQSLGNPVIGCHDPKEQCRKAALCS